jgi:ATP-binding cassette subfamily B protein
MAKRSESRWRALGALLWPDRARWAALALLVAVSSLLVLAGPLVVRRLVDRAAAGADSDELSVLAATFLVIALVAQVLAVLVTWRATTAAWTTTNQLRLDMARHVLGLDHEFHRKHTPGELIQRVDGDVTSVSEFLGLVVPKALGAALVITGMVAVLAVLDWRLAIGLVLYLAATFAVVVRGRHRAVRESSDEMNALGRLYGGIEERLVAAEDLRSNGAATHIAWRFVEDSSVALASAVRRERAFLTMWWFVQLALAAGWVVVLVLGAWTISNDVASIGTIFLLYQYVLLIGRPLEDLVHELETVQKANGAMVRVLDLLAIEPKVLDEGTISPPTGPLAVRIEHVDFDYGDDQAVLSDVTVELGAGRSIGIVGRTGSGKTTFSRLVLRLVEPTSGTVLLGGVPIADIPLSELRHRVALVSQEVELFAGTIRDNVTLFDETVDDQRVIDALRAVGLDGLVDGGIDRRLGSAGTGLSAGEAQLLSLARVWMRNPDLLVFDEATARIDPQTERQIEAAVAQLMVGRTTLIIAHRLSTLHAVDDILVFDHGRVAEFGPRSELVGDDESHFARLLALALDSADDSTVDREVISS